MFSISHDIFVQVWWSFLKSSKNQSSFDLAPNLEDKILMIGKHFLTHKTLCSLVRVCGHQTWGIKNLIKLLIEITSFSFFFLSLSLYFLFFFHVSLNLRLGKEQSLFNSHVIWFVSSQFSFLFSNWVNCFVLNAIIGLAT